MSTMYCYKLWQKNRSGSFSMLMYDETTRFYSDEALTPQTINLREEVEHKGGLMQKERCPLKWDLFREKKLRIWHKFWKGFFAQIRDENRIQPDPEVQQFD